MKRRRQSNVILPPLCVLFLLAVLASSLQGQGTERQYVGVDVCRGCHPEQTAAWEGTSMGKAFVNVPRTEQEGRACEACHGPGSAHVAANDLTGIFRFGPNSPASVAEQNDRCLSCHESGARTHWDGSVHQARGVACVSCHTVMKEVSPERQLAKATQAEVCYQCHAMRKAQSQQSSHMPLREGKVTCTDCHNPHGTTTPKLLVANSVNEVCYGCHQERRGPFLWEHAPVTENCMNCHDAHGSINDNLLRVRPPRLCQRCHIESRHPTTPQALSAARFVLNRSCTNCHSQIHGSNHPSGVRLHR